MEKNRALSYVPRRSLSILARSRISLEFSTGPKMSRQATMGYGLDLNKLFMEKGDSKDISSPNLMEV